MSLPPVCVALKTKRIAKIAEFAGCLEKVTLDVLTEFGRFCSTYLLAWVVGEFDFVAGYTKDHVEVGGTG